MIQSRFFGQLRGYFNVILMSLVFRSCGLDSLFQSVGLFLHAKKFVGESVGESRQSLGHGQSLIAPNGKVDRVAVDGIIAYKPAHVCKLSHAVRKFQGRRLLRKVLPLWNFLVDHPLDTHTKHRAGGSGRCVDDPLRFSEGVLRVCRHVLVRLNAASHGVGDFPINFQAKASAPGATPQADVLRGIELALIPINFETASKASPTIISVRPIFAEFVESLQDRVLREHRRHSAKGTLH